MLSDEWLSRYGLLENFNASVTRTRMGTGTWTTRVTAIALCTSCSRAKKAVTKEAKKTSSGRKQFFFIFIGIIGFVVFLEDNALCKTF